MRVVDSSAWIEWLSGSLLGQRIARELPANVDWVVPSVVQYELKRWSIRASSGRQGRISLAFSNQLILATLDSELANDAAVLGAKHSLAMADAIIYATAIKFGADLLTCDAHFAALPAVVYFAKTRP